MNDFDDVLANALIKQEKTDIKETNKDIEHPVIFNPIEPNKPISTPILSRINIEMMHDSNFQIMDNKNILSNDDEITRSMLFDLYADQFVIIKNTLINNIIESSLMSFNNYWEYAKNNILCNVLEFESEFGAQNINCGYIFNKNLQESLFDIEAFITTYLGVFKNISEKVVFNKSDDMFNDAHNLVNYTEKKAINLSQYIMSIIVKSIHEALYQYLSNFRVENIIKKSSALKALNENGSNMKVLIEQVIGYALYNSLYNFTATCLYPSIYNILSNAQVTAYTLYNDTILLNENTDKNNNDIL